MSASVVDASVVRAYRETHYRVHDTQPFTLRVDHPCPALAAAHRRQSTECSTFITASNPCSVDVGEAVNARRHAEFERELVRRGLAFIAGAGEHPTNGWPPEPSFLVFGLTREAAEIEGRAWKQNAILWSGADAVPRLILLR